MFAPGYRDRELPLSLAERHRAEFAVGVVARQSDASHVCPFLDGSRSSRAWERNNFQTFWRVRVRGDSGAGSASCRASDETVADTAYHTEMDDVEIQDRIAALDALVPKEGALVRLDQYGGGPDESRITANKTGYLRLGIEILKGAYLPAENQCIPIDIGYLTSEDSDVGFDWFERTEGLPEHTSPRSGRIIVAVVLAIFAIFIFLALVGITTVAGWILHYRVESTSETPLPAAVRSGLAGVWSGPFPSGENTPKITLIPCPLKSLDLTPNLTPFRERISDESQLSP